MEQNAGRARRGVAAICLALALVTSLVSCANDDPKVAATATPTPSASPSEPPIDLQATAPRGRYTVRMTRKAHKPAAESISAERQQFVWRFKRPTCTETECAGKVRSSGGAVYDYVWDGERVILTRPRYRGRAATCVDGTFGSFKFVWRYFSRGLRPAQPVTSADSMPPRKLTGVITQRASYSKWSGCVRTSAYPRLVRYAVVLRKR